MTYEVVLNRLAASDLRAAYRRAAAQAPVSAARWLGRFQEALETRPERCELARENGKVDVELREYSFGRRPYVFRVIFAIDGQKVRVLRIRRAPRRFLTKVELERALEAKE